MLLIYEKQFSIITNSDFTRLDETIVDAAHRVVLFLAQPCRLLMWSLVVVVVGGVPDACGHSVADPCPKRIWPLYTLSCIQCTCVSTR